MLNQTAVPVDMPRMAGDFETITRWVQWLRAQGASESTVRMYTYGLYRLLLEQQVPSVAEITEEHVTGFLATIGKHSVARIQYFRGLRSFFRYCAARGLAGDPTQGIKTRMPEKKPPIALTEEELTRLLIAAAWRDPRRAWSLMLSYSIGTRRMEVTAIRPDDVQGDVVLLRECKGGKQRRVELCSLALVALAELKPWSNGTVLGGIRRQTLTEWAHQAARDAGLLPKVRGRTSHVLRASFITHLLQRGTPLAVVRDLVGHANIATTNVYAAVEDGERRAAVRRLDS